MYQIFVRINLRTILVECPSSYTISQVKQQVFHKEGIPKDRFRLSYGSKYLDDSKTLKECGLETEATLYVVPPTWDVIRETQKELHNHPDDHCDNYHKN